MIPNGGMLWRPLFVDRVEEDISDFMWTTYFNGVNKLLTLWFFCSVIRHWLNLGDNGDRVMG